MLLLQLPLLKLLLVAWLELELILSPFEADAVAVVAVGQQPLQPLQLQHRVTRCLLRQLQPEMDSKTPCFGTVGV